MENGKSFAIVLKLRKSFGEIERSTGFIDIFERVTYFDFFLSLGDTFGTFLAKKNAWNVEYSFFAKFVVFLQLQTNSFAYTTKKERSHVQKEALRLENVLQ